MVALRLVGLDDQQAARTGLLLFVGAPIVWLIAVAFGGFFEREVELQANTVAIRRWTEVWLRRPGHHLAPASAVRATVTPRGLRLAAGVHAEQVATRLWPSSAIDEIKDDLQIWGVPITQR